MSHMKRIIIILPQPIIDLPSILLQLVNAVICTLCFIIPSMDGIITGSTVEGKSSNAKSWLLHRNPFSIVRYLRILYYVVTQAHLLGLYNDS
ncbi:hypothetical protein D3C73_1119700 [compost metagenome]